MVSSKKLQRNLRSRAVKRLTGKNEHAVSSAKMLTACLRRRVLANRALLVSRTCWWVPVRG